MGNDIQIGEGNYGCSAVNILDLYDNNRCGSISHNNVSYWVSGLSLDIDVRIMKDTPEGETIKQMLGDDDGVSRREDIITYLESITIPLVHPSVIVQIINNITRNSFNDGERSMKRRMQKDFRDLIGLS